MAQNIGIVGGGSIGVGWAVVFASAGHQVQVCEVNADTASQILPRISAILSLLNDYGLETEDPTAVCKRVVVRSDLKLTVCESDYIFEAGPENVDQKIKLLGAISQYTPSGSIIASSSSAIPASASGIEVNGRERFLIAHPANPPYLIRVAEIVATPETSRLVIQRTGQLLTEADMSPVELHKEQLGFAFNRLQGALLREAYCLVDEGVLEAKDVDTLVRDGLALRWAVTGPFVTSHLNVPGGLRAHANRMGASYFQMAQERKNQGPWSPELVDLVATSIEADHPLENWERDIQARDEGIMLIRQARSDRSARRRSSD
jgi:3-hydroxyacyl-CoA dehydrogenase